MIFIRVCKTIYLFTQDQQFYMGQLETLLIRVIYIASAISLRVHSMQYAI